MVLKELKLCLWNKFMYFRYKVFMFLCMVFFFSGVFKKTDILWFVDVNCFSRLYFYWKCSLLLDLSFLYKMFGFFYLVSFVVRILIWYLFELLCFRLGYTTMAFFNRARGVLKQSMAVSKHINHEITGASPSIFQMIRCMSSSKVFVGGKLESRVW